MMKKLSLACLVALCAVSFANANTFTAEGGLLEPTHGYSALTDRWLINDGDFEGGTCINAPIWTCTTDNDCDWIADLVPLGLWNYSGAHIAWLGGFCGEATQFTSICQDVRLDGNRLEWYWLAYINDGGELITVTIDGEVIFSYITDLDDHLHDEYQFQQAYINVSWDDHTLCFNYELQNEGDNYFIDYVELNSYSGTEIMSFSTVKALY